MDKYIHLAALCKPKYHIHNKYFVLNLLYPEFVIVDSSLLADNLINLFQRTEPNQNFNPSLPLFLKLSLNTQRS